MVKRTKEKGKKIQEVLEGNIKNTNYIFLGVGLTMFIMNVTAFLSFVDGVYSYLFFDLSILSSMIIIIITCYNIYNN